MANLALMLGGIIFLGVAVLHALRLVFKVRVRVEEFEVPMQLSIAGCLVALILSVWMLLSLG